MGLFEEMRFESIIGAGFESIQEDDLSKCFHDCYNMPDCWSSSFEQGEKRCYFQKYQESQPIEKENYITVRVNISSIISPLFIFTSRLSGGAQEYDLEYFPRGH